MYKHFFKRFFDILLSFIAIVILGLPMLIIALVIKCSSKGPVIFKQERIGKNGKVFKILKFRTMVVGAEKTGSGVYSGKDDPRVTKVGKFLRATSLDEIPQLINILKGDMSIIGPRPVLTYYPKNWEEYTEEELKRFQALPGITGLAAVHGRKTNTVEERFRYDNEYVEKLSFGLDFKIFWLTVKVVLTGAGNEDEVSEQNNEAEVLQEVAATEDMPLQPEMVEEMVEGK